MTQYATIFSEHLEKYTELADQQRRTQSEIENVTEMLKASFNMMSAEEQSQFVDTLTRVLEQAVKRELGLTEATRNLLESNRKEWFNAVKVRDRLKEAGFDFSGYTSNPLASVHAVLKRFKRTEVKTRESAPGNKEYRWIKPSRPQPKQLDYPAMNPTVFANRLTEAQRHE